MVSDIYAIMVQTRTIIGNFLDIYLLVIIFMRNHQFLAIVNKRKKKNALLKMCIAILIAVGNELIISQGLPALLR